MQLSAEKIWNSAQEHLRSKLNADTYNMWFAPLRASAIDPNHVTLEAAERILRSLAQGQLSQPVAGCLGRRRRTSVAGEIQIIAGGNCPRPCRAAAAPAKATRADRVRPRANVTQRRNHISIPKTRSNPSSSATTTILPTPRPGRRPGARQILQSAFSLRRRRARQNASAARHRPACRRQ